MTTHESTGQATDRSTGGKPSRTTGTPPPGRTRSAALQRIDDLTAERHRPAPPPPGPAHDTARAREVLAEALRPAPRRRRRDEGRR